MTKERIWIGKDYPTDRVLVLGESWYGDYEGDLVTDAGWIQAYLDEKVTDRMYSKIANACGMSRRAYWHRVAYTNFVQRIGGDPSDRPTAQQYIDAKPRLHRLLAELCPRGVWILGEEQSHYSKPVIDSLGIFSQVAWHPARIGVTHARLAESWQRLQEMLGHKQGTPQQSSPLLPMSKISSDNAKVPPKPMTRIQMKLLVSNLPEPLVVRTYEFPKRAPVYQLTINGEKCQAANTQGGSPLRSYTYFIWDGISYYVSGHISPLATVSLQT